VPALIECMQGKASVKQFWIELPYVKIGSSIQDSDLVIESDRDVAPDAVVVEYVEEQLKYFVHNGRNNSVVRVGTANVLPGKKREWTAGSDLYLSQSTVLRLTIKGKPAPCPNPTVRASGSEPAPSLGDQLPSTSQARKRLLQGMLVIAAAAVLLLIAVDPMKPVGDTAPASHLDQLIDSVIHIRDEQARIAVVRLQHARALQQRGQATRAKAEFRRAYDQFRARLTSPDIVDVDRAWIQQACDLLSRLLLQSAPILPEWRG